MRTRKFKVYDKETGEISLLNRINFKNGQLLFEGSNLPKDKSDRYIVVEYNGLKDVSGIEIYEEDIVYNDIDGHMYVKWEDGCYFLNNYNGECIDSLYSYCKNKGVKVVGNSLKGKGVL